MAAASRLASGVFVAFCTSTMFGAVTFIALGNRFAPRNYLDPDRPPFRIVNISDPLATENTSAAVGILIMLGALYFLYDVRRQAAKAAAVSDDDRSPVAEPVAASLPKPNKEGAATAQSDASLPQDDDSRESTGRQDAVEGKDAVGSPSSTS